LFCEREAKLVKIKERMFMLVITFPAKQTSFVACDLSTTLNYNTFMQRANYVRIVDLV
jgi:hypothetical protein